MISNIKIFITEEIPSKNKGEAAILLGMMESLKLSGIKDYELSMLCVDVENNDFKNLGVKLLSYVKDIDQKNKIKAVCMGLFFTSKLTLFSLLYWAVKDRTFIFFKNSVYKEFVDSNIIVCGHDGIIEGLENKDNKFNKLITYSFIFFQIILLKLFLKKKICILGASIGPFRNFFIRKFAKYALSHVDLLTVRDPKTYDYLRKFNFNNSCHLTADFAYLMKPKKIDIEALKNCKGKLLVGLTVSTAFSVFMNNGKNETEKYDRYVSLKAEILDYLVKKYDADILFIPHGIKRGKDDRIVAKDVFEKMSCKNRGICLMGDYSPEELKYIIGKCDVFLGERTHSNIAATSMGVPGISISEPESHRNSMFVNLWGEGCVIEINNLNFEKIKKCVDKIIHDRDSIQKHLSKKIKIYESNAVQNALLLKKLING